MIQWVLTIWSLVPLPFLNPVWTSGISWARYCWSLVWRIFQFAVIHRIKGFRVVNEAEVDVFLEFPCFFYKPTDVGNLTSGSSAFSKSSLNIWNFSVHVLLKPSGNNFKHNLANMWNECNYMIIWIFSGIAFIWDWNENWPFPVLEHCWVFQICWHIELSAALWQNHLLGFEIAQLEFHHLH